MANPLDMKEQKVSPNVVPASFTPVPEQFAAPVTQELRTRQAQLAQGYTLGRINDLEIQLHKGWYKRNEKWQAYPAAQSDELLKEAIKVAKTVRTIMLDKIAEWAGNYTEEEIQAALPSVWHGYAEFVQPPTETVEDALAPEEMEPAVADKPEVPDDAPKSEVMAPDELILGDILGKIAEDNTKD